MKRELEKTIEKYLGKKIKELGGLYYKFVSPGNIGVPDRIIFLPAGKIIFVELKTETGVLTNLQKCQIEKLKKLGVDVRVVKGKKEAADFIEEMKHGI